MPRQPVPSDEAGALVGEAEGEHGVTLATRLGGERALPVDRGMVLLSADRLRRHLLVCGATGSGKTETVLRLAWTIAKTSDAPVFYLDGKGDRETASRFCALMSDAGRTARVFPNEPFDGWRGQPAAGPDGPPLTEPARPAERSLMSAGRTLPTQDDKHRIMEAPRCER